MTYPFQYEHGYRSARSLQFSLLLAEERPVTQALEWLEDARKHEPDVDGLITARLALLYAVCGQHGRMLKTVRKAIKIAEQQRVSFRSPGQLMLLVTACETVEQLRELGDVLQMALPSSVETVLASVENMDVTAQPATELGTHNIDWAVIERREQGGDDLASGDRRPAVMRLERSFTKDGTPGMRAVYYVGDAVMATDPPDDGAPDERFSPMSEEFVTQLVRQYVFLCPLNQPELALPSEDVHHEVYLPNPVLQL